MFKIIEGGTKPHIKTEFSSSADLCAREKVVIGAGETKIIPLGVKIDLEQIKNICFGDYKAFMKMQYPNRGFTGAEFEDAYKQFLKTHFFELKLRSSLAVKGLIISNGVGEIDIDYPDEIGLIVHNPISGIDENGLFNGADDKTSKDKTCFLIEAGERVAQIKLMPHKNYLMPDEYKSTEKRTGGFGSTNKID